jgi:hypothetical protein
MRRIVDVCLARDKSAAWAVDWCNEVPAQRAAEVRETAMSKATALKFAFEVSVEVEDETGDVLAVYFRIRKGKSHESREFADGAAIADYDKRGWLLGIELLAPCSVTIVDKLAAGDPAEVRSAVKRFVKRTCPRDLIAA